MKNTLLLPVILLAVVCAFGQDNWTLTNPLPQGSTLNSVVWTGALWVAVGEAGSIVTSPDGLNWTVRRSGNDHSINAVAWTGKRLVAVGVGITAISNDGITWVSAQSDAWTNALAWTGNLLVAVGLNGSISTSPDGAIWTPRTSGTGYTFNSVVWTGTILVAVGESGTIATSRDGSTWLLVPSQSGVELNSITWTGSKLIAVGGSLSGGPISMPVKLATLVSKDGTTWVPYNPDLPVGTAVVWTGTRLVLSGAEGSLWVSTDGQDWSKVADGSGWSDGAIGNSIRSFARSDSGLIGVGKAGLILDSKEGLEWKRAGSGNTSTLTGVVWTGQLAVAVGYSGTILTSSDGVTWTRRNSGVGIDLFAVVASDSMLVATGWTGKILYSRDGMNWVASSSPLVGGSLNAIASNGKGFVVVGRNGAILASSNGIDWQPAMQASGYELNSVAWTGDKFVTVGRGGNFGWDGAVLTSEDGAHWTERKFASGEGISVIRAGDQCYLLDGNGSIFNSADGISWSQVYQGKGRASALAWAGDRILRIGYDGLVSMDGVKWSLLATGVPALLLSATWAGTQFIAVGEGGTIAVSPKTVGIRNRSVIPQRQRNHNPRRPGLQFALPGPAGRYLINGAQLP